MRCFPVYGLPKPAPLLICDCPAAELAAPARSAGSGCGCISGQIRGRYSPAAFCLYSGAFSFVLGILAGSVAFHPALPQEGQYKVQGVISDEVTTGSFGQYRIALSDVHLDGRPFAGGAYWTFYSDIEHSELIPGKSVSFQASLYHPRGAENPDG